VRLIVLTLLSLLSAWAGADDQWLEIGADPQGKYYIDPKSIQVEGDTIRLRKRGVYNANMMETFGDKKVSFRESVGIIEIDCGRKIHRVVQMDIISPEGEVVWTTGKMNRMWDDIMPNTHGEATHNFVCRGLDKS